MARLKPWDILLVFQLIGFCASSRGPPRLIGLASQQITARVGTVIRLPCPVEADPPALMEWFKDKDSIHRGWERFRVAQKGLKIKDILMEDGGHYVCKATNGFGSVSLNITLRVVDGSTTVKQHNFFPPTPNKEQKKNLLKPRFMFPDKMRRNTVDRPTGSSVRFKCKALGHPRPRVRWLHNGRYLTEANIGSAKKPRWTLKLHNLTKENSGKYTCKVFNSEGTINYTYSLEVIEKIKKKPEILPPHPMNITVRYAGTASFQCRVRSEVQPLIEWLKKIENPKLLGTMNKTIDVNGHKFIVLKSGDVINTADGAYLNKLVISRATDADAGMYICLVANIMGYSFREAFLTVSHDFSDRSTQHVTRNTTEEGSSSEPSLPVVIALLTVVGLILVGVVIYWVQQRKRGCNGRSMTIQRFPVPTQDKDFYPAAHNPHMYPPVHSPHNMNREKSTPKPYSSAADFYSDISSASRSHPSHHQHQHAHYNC